MHQKSICVIGLGYIGLPTAALLAEKDYRVYGMDINVNIVKTVNSGSAHIKETDLNVLLKKVTANKSLTAYTDIQAADIYLITVPTPIDDNKKPDLSYVMQATKSLASHIKLNDLIILESTSPVGTTEKLVNLLSELRPDLKMPSDEQSGDIFICYCPERVLPGKTLEELVSNDRVIGGMSKACANQAANFYKTFVVGECITTNARTAELSKLSENAFRDVNIAFANELSMICDKLNISSKELIALANRHPRVNILSPGPGVGGHCIAVDPWFIADSVPGKARLIKQARVVNDSKPYYIIDKINQIVGDNKLSKIACFGITFKPNIDDVRESPAIEIVQQLAANKTIHISVVEPNLDKLPSSLSDLKNVAKVSVDEALVTSQMLVLLVDHDAFIHLDLSKFTGHYILDTKSIWQDHLFQEVCK